MAEENKEEKEVVEAEVVDDKKENGFKKFFGKVKKGVNDSMLEAKKENNYASEHSEFKAYTKDSLFPRKLSGEIVDGSLICFGNVEFPKGSVIIDENDKAYYVVSVEKTTVTSKVDDVTYDCEGSKIALDENVEEVNVIKADSRYFIFKGEDK
jgi:hypothetical protein